MRWGLYLKEEGAGEIQ